MTDSEMQFKKPRDQRLIKIGGSETSYTLTAGRMKELLAESSEAFSESLGKPESLTRPIDAFIEREAVADPLAARAVRAHVADWIERKYALYSIAPGGMLELGKYRRAHREILSNFHAESDQND